MTARTVSHISLLKQRRRALEVPFDANRYLPIIEGVSKRMGVCSSPSMISEYGDDEY